MKVSTTARFNGLHFRNRWLLLMVIFSMPIVAKAQSTCQSSDASASTYNSGWSNGSNDNSTGFGNWSLSTSGSGGAFVASSTNNDAGTTPGTNINTGGRAWGLWANSGGTSNAVRTFNTAMAIGASMSFSMDNGSINSGGPTVGFGLQNSSGQNLMEFYFRGGQSNYELNDGSGTNTSTGLGFTRGGLDIQITRTDTNTYTVYIVRKENGANATFNNRSFFTQSGGQEPAQIRFFNYNAGSGSDFDAFFNNLKWCPPCSASGGTVGSDQSFCGSGDPAAFTESVASTGTGTLSYQWQSSTVSDFSSSVTNISGATGTTYDAPSVSTTTYFRRVTTSTQTTTGATCTANSNTITITVNVAPAITTQPSAPAAVCSGAGTRSISVVATGTGLNYTWRKGGVAVSNGGAISGQGTATLTFTNPTTSDAGSYDVVISGTCTPSVTSDAVTLTVNSPSSSTTNVTVCSNNTPFTWNGNNYTTSGTYTYTTTNAEGCDSVATLNLTVNAAGTSTTNATVCSNATPYIWNGNNYSSSGTYTYTIAGGSANGCDSIATLNLTVNNTSSSTTNVSVCANDTPYTWNGNNYSTSGTYTYTTTNAVGCDSVATLNLTVVSTVTSTTNVTRCSNQLPYTWNGNNYSTSGTYTYTITGGSAGGCDSVATLNFTVNDTSTSTTNVTVCADQLPYHWNGSDYASAGTYTYTTTNAAGCDSVATLVLTVNSNTYNAETQTACDSYTWHGTTYTASGDYTYSYTNGSGCASVDTLHLTINASTHNAETQSACDSYTWHGTTYTTSGTYTYSYTNGSGCASVDTLHLTIHSGTFNAETQTACDSYTWHGTTYTSSGDYTYSYNDVNGCASVDTLHLTINASTHNAETQTACDSYTWHGTTYTSSGDYTYSYNDVNGCASVDTLHLTINASSSSSTSLTVCFDQLPYTWNGLTFNSAGTQTAHLTNAVGCDSAATLILSVNNGVDWANLQWPPSGSICEGGTYTIYGQVYEPGVTPGAGAGTGITVEFGYSTTNSNPSGWTNWSAATYNTESGNNDEYVGTFSGLPAGTYYYTFRYKLNSCGWQYGGYSNGGGNFWDGTTYVSGVLTVNPATHNAETQTACDSYTWHGTTYTTSGTYTYSYTNGSGCASVDTLHLTINASTHNAETQTACDSYTWHGTTYTSSGTYTYSYTNGSGCASVDTLHLTVNASSSSTTTITANNSYTWNGTTYTSSGTYTYTTTNAVGCDSVATLILTINLCDNTYSTENVTICSNQTPYTWNGNNYSSSGTYTYITTNAAGCDSIATLNLTVNAVATSTANVTVCASSLPYVWNGNNYSASGTYTYTITGGAANGCDSVATLNLTVNAAATSTTNVTICSNQTPYSWNGGNYAVSGTYNYTIGGGAANGCDSIATLNLTVNSTSSSTTNVSVCANATPYTWNGNNYSSSGTYTYTTTNAAGCDSVATLNLTVKPVATSTTYISICNNQLPYNWNGNNYTATGTYSYTMYGSAANGCDSVATLELTVADTSTSTTSVSVCASQLPYSWNSNSYGAAGTYVVHLTNIAGCDSAATLILSVYPAPAVPDTIIGTKDVCPYMGTGTQLTYYTHPVAGATSYVWSVPAGATLISGQGDTAILVTFDNTFNGGDITVSSQVGCAISAARSMAIAKYVPSMPTAVNGPTNVCIYMGQATTAKYYVTAVQYATSYTWTVPANATIVSGQGTDTIYVSYASNFNSGSVTCKANANCGSSSPRSLNITKSAPATPAAISGPTNSCPYNGTGTPVTYSISPVANAITYRWTLPANTTLVSATPDSLSVTITFNANFATGTPAQRTIKVKAISGCGNSADRSLAIGITIPSTPGPITGPSNVCAYVGGAGGNATYTIRKVANANAYVWTVPSFATIVSYSGGGNAEDDTSVVVSFNSSFVAGSVDSIKVQAVSTCGTSLARSLALKPVLPAIPGPITGPTDACPYMGTGDTVIYTIRTVPNATSYLWTLPVGMDTVQGYPTNDTVLYVTFNSSFNNSFLTVRSVSGCGTTPSARSITISKKLPVTPGQISGTTDACPLMGTDSTTFYTTRKVNYATSYSWTVPTGATIVSHPGGAGANDTIIEVSYSNTFSTGSITVKAGANCGSSGTRSLTIMRKIPSTPISISGTTDACPLMGTANTTFYTTRKVTNATSYNWAVPPGASIVSHPGGAGVNDTIIEVSYDNSFTSGNISVRAANNCWESTPRVLLVTRRVPTTPSLISATTPTDCPGKQVTYTISAVTNATYYLWTVPAGATIISGDSTTSIVVQYPDASVSDTIRVQAGNNCFLTAQRKLKVTLTACPPMNSKVVPVAVTPPSEIQGLDVQVMSNPTQYQFSMIISSVDNKTAVNMRVTDMRGRVLEARRNLRNGQTVVAGENYRQGVYFAEFTQGNLRKVVKLIKLQ
jgi:hypothetical protein